MSDEHDFESDFSEDVEPLEGDDPIDEPDALNDDLAWEDEEGQPQDQLASTDDAAVPLKKKANLKIIGGVVAAIVVLLLGLRALTHSPAPAAPPAAVVAAAPSPAIPAAASPSGPVIPPGGMMNNPSAIGSVEQMQASTANAADVASASQPAPLPSLKMPATAPVPAPAIAAESPPPPAAVPTQPSAPQPLTPLPIPAAPPVSSAAMPAPEPAATSKMVAPAVDAAAALAPVLSRLDAMDAEIKELKNNDADKNAIGELKQQIDALQNRIDALPKVSTAATAPTAVTEPVTSAQAPVVRKVAVPHWTLRSAEPGEALLADQNGKLSIVHAGDTLSGLGRVLSIAEHAGSWSVRGTEGQVTE